MVACSMGEVTVLTGAAGLRVEGVNCCLGALSFECSIESLPLLMSARRGEIGAVTVTMPRSYQSAAGYGRRCPAGFRPSARKTKSLLTSKPAKSFRKAPKGTEANFPGLEQVRDEVLLCALCETLATFAVNSFRSRSQPPARLVVHEPLNAVFEK